MSENLQGAIRETFKAAVNAVHKRLRDSFILIGGAATFLSGVTERHTFDLDFAAGQEAMNAFLEVVMNKERGFKMDDDFTVIYWTSYEFYVPIDLLILGGDFVAYVESLQRLESGFLASIPDLLLLRSITIEERGDDKDLDDFVDLMRLARQRRARFGFLTEEQIKRIVGAAMLVGTKKGIDPSDIMPLLSVWMRAGVLRGRLGDDSVMTL